MCLINFLRQSRSNVKRKSDWKGFSVTIKRQKSQRGEYGDSQGQRIHNLYYNIYCNLDDSQWTGLGCKSWDVEDGLKDLRRWGHFAEGAAGSGMSPDAHHRACIKPQITLDSHSLSPVITNNSRAICWLPDKRIRPSSASWRSGHHPEAIDGAARWWKGTCQRRVYDINSQVLPCWILFYFIRFILLSPFAKKKKPGTNLFFKSRINNWNQRTWFLFPAKVLPSFCFVFLTFNAWQISQGVRGEVSSWVFLPFWKLEDGSRQGLTLGVTPSANVNGATPVLLMSLGHQALWNSH